MQVRHEELDFRIFFAALFKICRSGMYLQLHNMQVTSNNCNNKIWNKIICKIYKIWIHHLSMDEVLLPWNELVSKNVSRHAIRNLLLKTLIINMTSNIATNIFGNLWLFIKMKQNRWKSINRFWLTNVTNVQIKRICSFKCTNWEQVNWRKTFRE